MEPQTTNTRATEIPLNRTSVQRRRTLRAPFAERNFTHAKRLIATTTIPIRRRGVAHTLAVHLHVLGLANSKIIVNVFTANLLPLDNVPVTCKVAAQGSKMMLVVSLCCPAAPFQVYAHVLLPAKFAVPTNYVLLLPSTSHPRSARKA